MNWYYVENGQQAGPVEDSQLGELLQTGRLHGDTLVWHEGMANWQAFSAVCPPELAAAVLAPWVPLALLLCAVTGVFAGPIYPMLIAIGGDLYPRRLAALSGGLTAAATVGAIIYPPLMGIVADQVGIKIGLLGAALLGLPAAAALLLATGTRRHNHTVLSGITAGRTEP